MLPGLDLSPIQVTEKIPNDLRDQTLYVEFFLILVQNLAGTDECIEPF